MFVSAFILFITIQSYHSTNAGPQRKEFEDPSPIKYPGPFSNRYGDNDDPALEVPKECEGKGFCTVKPQNYPQDEFNKMFKGKKVVPPPTLILDVDDLNRQGDDSDDGCGRQVSYEPLYQVRSEEGDWRTVIQAPDEDYIQRIRLEECEETNSNCFTVFPDMPGYEKMCKQTYNSWEVLVAPKDGKSKPERIKTELPVCCSCNHRVLGARDL